VTRAVAGLLVAVLVALTTGCEVGQDDERAAPPRRTITASPSPDVTVAPTAVPVGEGKVAPDDVVWAQGSVLHVGRRSIDLSPVGIDAFVVVRGGVFVLSSGELWFTDLTRLRGTGLTGVTGLGVTADARAILVSAEQGGAATAYGFDTRTGQSVDSEDVDVAPAAELLGDPGTVDLADGRWTGFVPKAFDPVGRVRTSTVYGFALRRGRPTAVVGCDTGTHRCARLGVVAGSVPVVFGTGR
jgi:hypothetical protein